MTTFSLATSGYPQNATYQTQYANAFNGSTTASVSLAGITKAPLLLQNSTGATTSYGLAVQIAGDANPRGLFLNLSGGGELIAQTSAAALQANLYYGGSGQLNTDQGITLVSGKDLQVNSATNVTSALSVTNAPSLSGTVTVSGMTHAYAPNMVSGGHFYTNGNGYANPAQDSSSGLHIAVSSVNGTARGLRFQAANNSNSKFTGFQVESNGRISIGTSGQTLECGASNSQNLSRVSTASASISYAAPSYGNSTVSHGLGLAPTAGVMTMGDGGAFSGTVLGGFDLMGSSTVRLWASLSSGQTVYGRFTSFEAIG